MNPPRLSKRALLLCTVSLLLNNSAFAAKLTPSSIQYPTCQNAAGGICIDLPGSATPAPTSTTATASAAKKTSTSARTPVGSKPLTQTGITSTSSGVLYYVDTNQEIHQLYWGGSQWYDANVMSSSQSGYHVAYGTSPG